MASPTSVDVLLEQHPGNLVKGTCYPSSINKPWAKNCPPMKKKINVHTYANEDGGSRVNLDEEDGINWFGSEVSNIVLAAWA